MKASSKSNELFGKAEVSKKRILRMTRRKQSTCVPCSWLSLLRKTKKHTVCPHAVFITWPLQNCQCVGLIKCPSVFADRSWVYASFKCLFGAAPGLVSPSWLILVIRTVLGVSASEQGPGFCFSLGQVTPGQGSDRWVPSLSVDNQRWRQKAKLHICPMS